MVTNWPETGFGGRLRQERRRLGRTQVQFAELGGVSRHSQLLYESDKRFPDAKYLMRLAGEGLDLRYLLAGSSRPDSTEPVIPTRVATLAFEATFRASRSDPTVERLRDWRQTFLALCDTLNDEESLALEKPTERPVELVHKPVSPGR